MNAFLNCFTLQKNMEIDIILLTTALLSATFSLIFAMLLHYLRSRDFERRIKGVETDVDAINADLDSLDMALRGKKGREVRAEKDARKSEAMAEAFALMQQGKKPEEIIAMLAPKYLDVGLELLQGKK